MKNYTPLLFKMCLTVLLMHFFCISDAFAAPAEDATLYSFAAYGGDLYTINTSDYSYSFVGSVNGDIGPVETINGADVDPNTNEIYIIASFNYDRRTRYLATIDLETRNITTIGNLGDKFASIAFDDNGALYGLTGAGADQDSSLFIINTEDASSTFLAQYDNDNGEVLAFNEDDGLLYRATGDQIYSIDPENPSVQELVMSNWDLNGPEAFYHNGGTEFIYGDWDDIYIVDTAEDSVEYVGYMDDGTRTYFYWPVEKSLNIQSLSPQKNSSTTDVSENLILTFDRPVFAGSGGITVRRYADDFVLETLDIALDRVTGWGSSTITIDLATSFSYNTKYYVTLDAGAIIDENDAAFSGFITKDEWFFSTRPFGNDFDFDDTFSSLDFIDNENTDAQWRQGEEYFTLGGAAGVWTRADRETEGKENIQNDWMESGEDPQIALNNDDEQMVVWAQEGKIMFTRWDSENGIWSWMNGEEGGAEDISSTGTMGCDGSTVCGDGFCDWENGETEANCNIDCGTTYYLSQVHDGEKEVKYSHHFPIVYEGKNFSFTPIDNTLELHITQKDAPFADIDQLELTACESVIEPEYARYADDPERDLRDDLRDSDLNVIVAHEKNIEILWTIPDSCEDDVDLYMFANEYGTADPFSFEGSYEYGGVVTYEPYWEPVTGHPDGYTYITITDDDEKVYYELDITMDNTDDYGEDWTEVVIGEQVFHMDDLDDEYGYCDFGFVSDAVPYKHQMCYLQIPKSEIDTEEGSFDFQLRYYGTGGGPPPPGPEDTGSAGCSEAFNPQIIADADGNPVVAWIGEYDTGEVSERRIFVRRWDGESGLWTTMDGSQEDADIVLPFSYDLMMGYNSTFHMISNSQGNPMIAADILEVPGERNVFYAEWDGLDWTGKLSENFDVLVDESDLAYNVQIARNADDDPYFVWLRDEGREGVRFTHWDGSTYRSLDSGDNPEYDILLDNVRTYAVARITMNSQGNPVIAFGYSDEDSALVLNRWNGSAWENYELENQDPEILGLGIDENDVPIIAWVHWGSEVRAAQLSDGAWKNMSGDSGYDEVKSPDSYTIHDMHLGVDSNGYPLIVWSMQQMHSVHFSQWNGSSWVRGDGETAGDDSLSGDTRTGNLDMVLNSADEPSVVWAEVWGDADVHFSVLPRDIESPKTVQSTKVNGTITGIISASLTATEYLNGESYIDYFLSGDGGNNWLPVENGGSVSFSSAHDLRWRARLYKGSVPELMDVHVDFQTQGVSEPEPEELCNCYVIGSAESDYPEASVQYSDDNGTTWTYTPQDNGDGMDCYVTNVKLLRNQTSSDSDQEIVEADFTGSATDTRVVNTTDGEVILQDYSIGTHTFGSPYEDTGNDIAVDAAGNFYVTGYFNNTVNFDDTGGADIHSTGGTSNEHLYITRYNADHSYGWTRSIGSNGDVRGYGIAVDPDGNIIVAGGFAGTVDFDYTSGTDSHSSNGSWDIFITKHNADGTYAWTRTFGGSNSDIAYGVDVDDAGDISITGSFSSTMDFDATAGTDTHSVTLNQYNDVFTTKYNADGSYGWTHTFGNNMADYPKAVAVDGSGNVYVTGYFQSRIDFDDSGGVDMHGNWSAFDSFYDVYVTKYNANGSYGWTRTIGTEVVSGGSGRGTDEGHGIAVDNSGNVFVTGMYVGSIDFDTTGGTDERTSNGEDAFLTKYSTNGTYEWTRTFGGSDEDTGYAVTTDDLGNIFVTGYFETDFDPDGSGSVASRSAIGFDDVFVVRYDADGSFNWSHVFGGNTFDHGNGIVTDSSGDVLIAGRYRDTVNFDDDGGIDENTSNGNYDVFVTKYNSDGSYGAYASFYASSGTYQTTIDSTGTLSAWETFTADHALPSDTNISYEIQDASCTTTLAGPTSATSLDLSSISGSQTTLCLTALLTTSDTSATPMLNEWQALFLQDLGVTEEEIVHKTVFNPRCVEPKDPEDVPEEEDEKECSFDSVRDVTTDSVTLRASVDDSYADEKVKFKVEVENLYTDDKETIKLTEKPSDNGKVTLLVDNLEADTKYRFKVSYDEDEHDGYLYCPHSKTETTDKRSAESEKEPERYPECGNASKTYTNTQTVFSGAFCAVGTEGVAPSFPAPGESVTWTCSIDGNTEECHAKRDEDVVPELIKGGSEPEDPLEVATDQKEIIELPEEPLQATAVLGLITGTIIAFATSAVPLFATMPMAAKDFFIMPFIGIVARRKNEQNWGTVFESTTKQPIPGTKLMLTDQNGKEVETTYSDAHGRFGFLTANGTYAIQIEKAKFDPNFAHSTDPLYGEVYTGDLITIDENRVIATNIALSAQGINWSEYAQKKSEAYKGFFSTFKKWLFIILFYAGFIFTGVVTYLYPSWINFTLLVLYVLLFVYDHFIKRKKYGTVESSDKNPVPFAIVSLHDKNTSEKKNFAVTDVIGRYYLLSENGSYDMKVKGQPIGGHNFEKQGDIHVRDGIVRKDIKI